MFESFYTAEYRLNGKLYYTVVDSVLLPHVRTNPASDPARSQESKGELRKDEFQAVIKIQNCFTIMNDDSRLYHNRYKLSTIYLFCFTVT